MAKQTKGYEDDAGVEMEAETTAGLVAAEKEAEAGAQRTLEDWGAELLRLAEVFRNSVVYGRAQVEGVKELERIAQEMKGEPVVEVEKDESAG